MSRRPKQAKVIIDSPIEILDIKRLAPVAIAAAAIHLTETLTILAQDFKVLNGCDHVNRKDDASQARR